MTTRMKTVFYSLKCGKVPNTKTIQGVYFQNAISELAYHTRILF